MSGFGKNNCYNLRSALFQEFSAIPLALFRICFGGVLFYEFGRLLWSPVGAIRYLDPIFHFKYPFFEWVVKGPDWLMQAVFVLGVVLSATLTLGLFYRLTTILLFFCYNYLFLLDVSYWNNHYYLYGLFLLFFILVNAHATLSVDVLMRKNKLPVYGWQVGLFKFQIIVVYVYGALSKLVNPDWMSMSSVESILNNSLVRNGLEISDGLMQFLVSIQTYGGIGFDFFIGFILLSRRTFLLGAAMSLIFHGSNFFFLNIGSFPAAMMGTLFLFIPEAWLSRSADSEIVERQPRVKLTMAFLGAFGLFQLLFPLKHFFYEGLVFWTGEGKLCSWHMMSGSTTVNAAYFYLYETDAASGDTLDVHTVETAMFLSDKQQKTLGKWPFLVPQFASFLKQESELAGIQNVMVSADVFVSRNGRRYKLIVKPDVDLSSVNRKLFGHNEWILLYAEEHY